MMKSKTRVHPAYKEGTRDWQAQYDMLLDDGVTCADCMHVKRCVSMFGQMAGHDYCQFYPNRFARDHAKQYRRENAALRQLVRCLDGERTATRMFAAEAAKRERDREWLQELGQAMTYCMGRTYKARAALKETERLP